MEKVKEIFNKETINRILIFIVIGILIHLELIVRQSSNPDTYSSGLYMIAGSWEVSLGRWLNVIISNIRFGLSSTVFSTIISLIIMIISSIFIIDLLEIKKKTNKIFCTLLCIIAPSFTATLTYFYCSDVYNLAMFLAVLMPWCIFKLKHKKMISIFLGAICLTLSLGGYQSYLGVSLSLCIMVLILKLREEHNLKNVLEDFLRVVTTLIIAFILYGIISYIFLLIYNVGVATYKGTDEISIINTLLNFPKGFINAYENFFDFFYRDNIIHNTFFLRHILNIGVLILFVVLIILRCKKNKKGMVISIILTLLLPVACNAILFISTSVKGSNAVMSMPLFMIYIFLISIIDKFEYKKIFLCIYAILSVIIFTYVISINATYISVDLVRKQAVQMAQRIRTNIEAEEGYEAKTKLCMVGGIKSSKIKRDTDFENMYKMSIGLVTNWEYQWKGSYWNEKIGWNNLYTKELLIDYNSCSDKEYKQIIESKEFKEMPVYPDTGSIKFINDILVVKLTQKPYKN